MSKREQGFTFLEVIFCLSILLLLITLVPRTIPKQISIVDRKFLDFEWALCLEQIQIEFREATSVTVINNKLLLQKNNGQMVKYEKSGNDIIRTVDNKGHEIMLQQITSVSFELQTLALNVHVIDLDKKDHSGMITRFFPIR
ncbi:competence type IV pilus minor pilin ComGF [Ectobacillus polymachus]|uniref:competence type IV pilus minor pilin ComGF n=1 Tax=Ectobacillus polymachus TaxID=1508806 RepID=UPI003A892FB1